MKLRNNLGLRAGDWVEVRPEAEILATLDEFGRLDDLPFMPEMLQYCGKRLQVSKSAHKTCDTISTYKNRGMKNGVHLDDLRCNGSAHGGCQAGCLIFWKTAWLKRVAASSGSGVSSREPAASRPAAGVCDHAGLARAARRTAEGTGADERFVCQATEMERATNPLAWWDPRQYVLDVLSGNVRLFDLLKYLAMSWYRAVMRRHPRAQGIQFPSIRGLAEGQTPTATLNLQPGELVEVRSKKEIMTTINAKQKNRGLWFDVEMLPFCNRRFRVLRRVERIVDEKTGKMLSLPGVCLILDGVSCGGNLSRDRMFCPRAIYPYWREIWLKRAESDKAG